MISHFKNETLIKHCKDYTAFQLNKGSGTATIYRVFRGIEVIELDIQAPQYLPKGSKSNNALEINYCLSGRAECKMEDGCVQYIGQGDLFLTTVQNHSDSIDLPLKYYSGLVFHIDFDQVDEQSISALLGDTLHAEKIFKPLFQYDQCFFLQAREITLHFFAERNSIAPERKRSYYRLKTLGLLLYLEQIDPNAEKRGQVYTIYQIDIIKQIELKLTTNLQRRITIDDLSREFNISKTAIKTLFKEVYGKPISAYMKVYRLQRAKTLLMESDHSISEIATQVGYQSQSKFGAVFRSETGFTPYEYRKKKQ